MRRIILLFLVFSLTLPLGALAQDDTFEIENPLEYESIGELIDAIINFIFYIAITVAPIMIIYAGFLFVTSAGNKDKVAQAKKLIFYALLGVAIIYAANILIDVIQRVLE